MPKQTRKITPRRSGPRSSQRVLLQRRAPLLTAGIAAMVLVAVAAVVIGNGYHTHPSSHAATLVDLPDFRMECNIDHFGPDDPIVYPGVPGASHMHSFYSNTSTNAFTTTSSLQANIGSCNYTPTYDRSAYWVPSLYIKNADGSTTQYTSNQQRLVVYYRKVGGVNGPAVHPIPAGLRMIAGDSHATAPQPSSIAGWDCADGGPEYPSVPDCTNAQSGNNPVGFVSFPNCWDGVHLDSADHKSHMAYPVDETTGQCPADHPVSLPRIDFEDWLVGTTGANAVLSSDLSAGSQYTMHGDFFAAWDPRLLNGLIDTCMNTTPQNCSTVQVWNGCCGSTNGDVTANGGTFLFNLFDPKYAASPTPTPSGSPTATKTGDLNGDGQVNVFDLSIMLSAWGGTNASADINKDGTVNVFDLSILLSQWGT